jgi:hypothetical protein
MDNPQRIPKDFLIYGKLSTTCNKIIKYKNLITTTVIGPSEGLKV